MASWASGSILLRWAVAVEEVDDAQRDDGETDGSLHDHQTYDCPAWRAGLVRAGR